MVRIRNANNILSEKPEMRHRLEELSVDIIRLDVIEVEHEGVDWINLAQERH
jgi:hypothetical protein